MNNGENHLKLVEVPLEMFEEIKGQRQSNASVVKLLCDFMESGMVIAEVKHSYANINSARSTFANAARRNGLNEKIDIIQRNDRLFLLRRES